MCIILTIFRSITNTTYKVVIIALQALVSIRITRIGFIFAITRVKFIYMIIFCILSKDLMNIQHVLVMRHWRQ